ncbi:MULTISPECIES: hypothetical protein [unclassified Herbaspirillum]|uniref:hypothetical protein n=1 Tax=unclassified Herbaspirillum TaxID=2624150 RepID=UPI000E2EF408|nr:MULTISPECIES: hypothetical protein [unclassified Herbaspirillum]RFB67099.1 hypothetical protein DZB54_21585 [Herbaspirillum sp. 3R-3a1]TFI06139.1 hypothetical protein E4P32_17525 [Herbaspirillum sp. 3R11]TFI14248.1 hypothetical protein E4P31_15935 [Herbaspirillum sp. 3R-11]TFI30369.1 hypothetical protein E4P30_04210 [Herbaspirillum sp. 3C11]
MDSINNQFFINNTASPTSAKAYAKNDDIGFAQMMATRGSVDGLSGAAKADVSPALTMALGGLIGRYGINVPPKLRILPTKKKYVLEEGDDRSGKFDMLITDNPGVSELLTQAHTKALTDREAAMESAIDTFMRGKGGYDMRGFLTEFKEEQKPRAVSVVYDGLGTYVEEQDARGAWRLVKGESDFMDDLMKAYTRYNTTNAAVEYNKGKSLPTLNREQVSQGG